MKIKIFYIILITKLFFSASNIVAQIPYFELKDLNNNYVTYEQVKGEKLTVIDFWATWCQPCLRSIPELIKLSDAFEEQGVKFIGISVDGPRNQSKLKPFVTSIGVKYTILRDINGEIMSELNVTAVPTLIIYDGNGKQVFIHEGFRPGDERIIKQELEKLL